MRHSVCKKGEVLTFFLYRQTYSSTSEGSSSIEYYGMQPYDSHYVAITNFMVESPFLTPPIFEPTCAYAQWTLVHRFLSVWVCETYVVHHLMGAGLRCAPPTCVDILEVTKTAPHDKVAPKWYRQGHCFFGRSNSTLGVLFLVPFFL